VLAEFASVVNAVQCGVAIQATLKLENASRPLERRMQFCIGVNLGDVMMEGAQIYDQSIDYLAVQTGCGVSPLHPPPMRRL
jgi:adenylate cyclase